MYVVYVQGKLVSSSRSSILQTIKNSRIVFSKLWKLSTHGWDADEIKLWVDCLQCDNCAFK